MIEALPSILSLTLVWLALYAGYHYSIKHINGEMKD